MSETIHERLVQVIKREKMSVAAFERALNVGRNSISTSLRKKAAITHDVIQKIAEHFPHYSIEWLILGKKSEKTIEIQRLYAEVFRIFEAWKADRDKISLQK
ncbi:MAG: hypothetical protein ACPF99_04780 [Flavobacteriaceae bacterium]